MNVIYKTMLDYKGKYGIWGVSLLVLAGVAFLVLPGLFLDKQAIVSPAEEVGDKVKSTFTIAQIEDSLAQQVSSTLKEIEGVGSVVVSISLETGYKQEYAQNITSDSSTIKENDNAGGTRTTNTTNQRTEVVFAQNRNEALVETQKAPEIRGVLVVADGAKDSDIKMKLSHAVQAMLDLPAHRVMVVSKESR
jgi:stage III sporulation protein AG